MTNPLCNALKYVVLSTKTAVIWNKTLPWCEEAPALTWHRSCFCAIRYLDDIALSVFLWGIIEKNSSESFLSTIESSAESRDFFSRSKTASAFSMSSSLIVSAGTARMSDRLPVASFQMKSIRFATSGDSTVSSSGQYSLTVIWIKMNT